MKGEKKKADESSSTPKENVLKVDETLPVGGGEMEKGETIEVLEQRDDSAADLPAQTSTTVTQVCRKNAINEYCQLYLWALYPNR